MCVAAGLTASRFVTRVLTAVVKLGWSMAVRATLAASMASSVTRHVQLPPTEAEHVAPVSRQLHHKRNTSGVG